LDQETYIHDKHRGTKLAEEFLAGLSKPKLKESTPEPPKKNGKRGGRPKGSRVQFWLSKAEQEVVDLMCDGYKSNEIGKIVGKSTASVCTALDRAKRKTGARSNYHLVAMAVSKKLKEDPDHGGYWREGKERDQEDRTVGASKPSEAA
jgi:DNA-binding CsgD family transcriptional regulator